MKNVSLKSDIFALIGVLLLVFMFMVIYPEYMSNHKYYFDMVNNSQNINLILASLFFSLIVLGVLIWFRKLKAFLISLFIGLVLFAYIYISSKSGGLIGSGILMILVNISILFGFALFFIASLLVIGRWIKIKLFKLEENNLFGIITGFGLGLVSFLILNYLLILFDLMYPFISWIIFFGMLIFTFIFKSQILKDSINIINNFINNSVSDISSSKLFVFGFSILFVISIMYFYFGFLMSYIPYPTAWDANHAYMFYPKMWALNNGYYWDEINMATMPYLWLSYITFWFSLFVPFYNSFWISPDSFAVVMNFFSGIFVLLFSLAVLGNFDFKKFNEGKKYLFLIGWAIILLWLTSGMGAFLVFVDNKTDLGILTLVILALYSGFLLFKNLYDKKFDVNIRLSFQDNLVKLAILSGIFFAIAVMSKPTAFFDVFNFAIFFIFSVFSHGIAVGLFFFAIALLGFMKFRGIVDYMSLYGAKISAVLGVIFSISGILELLYKFKNNWTKFKNLFMLFMIWGLSYLTFLILFKGLYLVLRLINFDQSMSLGEIIRFILFA